MGENSLACKVGDINNDPFVFIKSKIPTITIGFDIFFFVHQEYSCIFEHERLALKLLANQKTDLAVFVGGMYAVLVL